MDAATETAAKYDTHLWVVVRWIAVLPGGALVALVAFVVLSFVNNLFGEVVSGIADLLAAGYAGYCAVVASKVIAPRLKRGAGIATATMLAILIYYVIAMIFTTPNAPSEFPKWYMVVVDVVFAIGLLTGVFVPEDAEVRTRIAPPPLVRWIIFLPASIAAAACAGFALVFARIQFTQYAGIIDAETFYIPALVLISLAIAIAPSGKRLVASLVSCLWVSGGFLFAMGAVLRPILVPWLESTSHREVGFMLPQWSQFLQGFGWFAAGCIPLVVTFCLPRAKK